MERPLREILLGLWKVHILHHAAERGTIGNHLLLELHGHGYDVSPGTLYPLLHRMERNGWLESHRDDGSHSARTYDLTAKGAEALTEIRAHVDDLFHELHEVAAPRPKPINRTQSRETSQRRRGSRGG